MIHGRRCDRKNGQSTELDERHNGKNDEGRDAGKRRPGRAADGRPILHIQQK